MSKEKKIPLPKINTPKHPLAIAVCVLALVVVIVMGFVFAFLVQKANTENAIKTATDVAKTQAQEIAGEARKLQQQADTIAARADVQALMIARDAAGLDALAKQLVDPAAGIKTVHFVLAGEASRANLKFTVLDMLSRAEDGKKVDPEVLGKGKEGVIHLVSTVKNPTAQDAIVGMVHLEFPALLLEDVLAKTQASSGKMELIQHFEDGTADVVLLSTDAEGMERFAARAQSSIAHWFVQFSPSPEFVAGSEETPWNLIAVMAGLLLLLGFIVSAVLRNKEMVAAVEEAIGHHAPIQIASAKRIEKGQKVSLDSMDQMSAAGSGEPEMTDPLFQSGSLLDDDSDLMETKAKPAPKLAPVNKIKPLSVSQRIFRDYDIRGVAETEITDDVAYYVGLAFAVETQAKGEKKVVLAGDGRVSTPRIKENVQRGLLEGGCDVIDIGNVPTPVMNFATMTLEARSGVMVTASHNPPGDNGFKLVVAGKTLSGEAITDIRQRIESGNCGPAKKPGSLSEQDVLPDYLDRIVSDIPLASAFKVVVDCANGIGGKVAPQLLEELGCDVVPLFCEVDGNFPNHAPDPSVMSNLDALIAKVKEEQADIGIALDGDADRIGIVSASGEIILPDSLLMLFAKDIVSRNPGTDVIYDVKSTRRLGSLVSSYGGRPVMWKSGHSHIKNKVNETGAMLGGELSGHIFIKERWFGFDDGIYAAARLLEIMSIRDQSLDEIFAGFPTMISTPEIRVPVDEAKKFSIVQQLAEKGDFSNAKLTTIDGVRADYAKGWGLVRASNTAAELTLRFEAETEESLAKVKEIFREQLLAVDKTLSLPF